MKACTRCGGTFYPLNGDLCRWCEATVEDPAVRASVLCREAARLWIMSGGHPEGFVLMATTQARAERRAAEKTNHFEIGDRVVLQRATTWGYKSDDPNEPEERHEKGDTGVVRWSRGNSVGVVFDGREAECLSNVDLFAKEETGEARDRFERRQREREQKAPTGRGSGANLAEERAESADGAESEE